MYFKVHVNTVLEVDLPPYVKRLELISPFVFSTITLTANGETYEFEIMPLEFFNELVVFLTSDEHYLSGYRTNITPGGDEFSARMSSDGSISIAIYDKVTREMREIGLTLEHMRALISSIYDQILREFRDRCSSEVPIQEHRSLLLAALSAWRTRLAGSTGSPTP